jgi:hypothetical protein
LVALAGTLLLMAATATAGHAALEPFHSDSGFISLSVDAVGTNDPAGAPIDVHKNAGATVRKAFLFAASTGFSGYTPVDGDVTIDGSPVAWDSAHTIPNAIGSINVVSDVTSLVKPKVDAAPAGDVTFTVAEPTQTFNIEGEVLAVILSDPTVARSGSVILLYGAQQTTGDTFHVALAEPVDKSNPDFGLNLSLGISYGFQPSGQFSTVDVNSTRMTSSAGGQDDSVDVGNGTLITAGGIGDLNDNPADPNATDETCGSAPRCDDELYSLLPFVNNGDTSLTFNTTNPSSDDNIFFGALDVRGGGAIVGKGVVLSPVSATNNVGTPHTLTATVQDDNGNPISGVTVHFQVTSGPNAGTNGDAVTGTDGKAQFTYTSTAAGTDTIVASFTDAQGTHTSNEVTKTWQGSTPPPTGGTGRMTGGGKVVRTSVTHGLSLNCDQTKSPNNLEVNWKQGNKFHLTTLTSAACSNDPAISEGRPIAGFDTYRGTGTGTYNGSPGATAEWVITDAGEPGDNDTFHIKITDAGGNVVLDVTGKIKGNHQAQRR